MCGIAGLLADKRSRLPEGAIETLIGSIAHRGPDARGTFIDNEAGVALGHQRLAIVDLSENGAQPMASASARYVIVLNGEIYNFRELRNQLEAEGVIGWRGTSDTEVLLAGIERWGIDRTLDASDGMFAFSLWDRQQRRLTLARDRFGEKPLIVAFTDWGLAFSSQLGGLMAVPGFAAHSDEESIDQFLALSYVPEPRTPFRDAFKVPAGTYCVVVPGDRQLTPVSYWSPVQAARKSRKSQAQSPEKIADIKQAIEMRLQTVVRNQMLADVPLGAFLSGGIDSSLVVALMQEQSDRPVRTFTIGFEEESYDEAPHAVAVARHLGTDHEETILSWRDALQLVPDLPNFYDEPFADSSQLPTCLVSRVARQKVTVALTGDAGDEIFGGYNRHVVAAQYGGLLEMVPSSLKAAVGALLARPFASDRLLNSLNQIGIGRNIRQFSEKANKFAAMLRAGERQSLYHSLIRRDEGLMGAEIMERTMHAANINMNASEMNLAEYMMLMDSITYLPGDILTKVDRASMAVALETRAPYLDHRLFELAWCLPVAEHIKNGRSKTVLREMLARRLPVDLFDRPKAGFGVPISNWLRGALKDWLRATTDKFKEQNPNRRLVVDRALSALEAGSPTVHHFLWNVAMLQGWRDRYQSESKTFAKPVQGAV